MIAPRSSGAALSVPDAEERRGEEGVEG